VSERGGDGGEEKRVIGLVFLGQLCFWFLFFTDLMLHPFVE
jgi:hypothetical protein